MTKQSMNCEQVQQLVFELEELFDTGLPSTVREQIETHLKGCGTCRELRQQEQTLTKLLSSGVTKTDERGVVEDSLTESQLAMPASVPVNSGFFQNGYSIAVIGGLMTVAAVAGLVVGSLIQFNRWVRPSDLPLATSALATSSLTSPFESNGPWGSITRRPVVRNVSFQAAAQELDSANHIELPTGAAATIELTGAGTVSAVGPAVFELDRVVDGWKLTIFEGQVSVLADGEHKIQVATRNGTAEVSAIERMFIDSRYEEMVWATLREYGSVVDNAYSNQYSQANDQERQEADRQEAEGDDPDKLRNEAMGVFHDFESGPEEMKRSAELLKQLMDHPDAPEDMKTEAEFYRIAALANAEQIQEALTAAQTLHAKQGDAMNEVAWHVMAECNWKLGNEEKARSQFRKMLKLYPTTAYAPMIAGRIGTEGMSEETMESLNEQGRKMQSGGQGGFAPESSSPFTSKGKSKKYNADQQGYLVVEVGLVKGNAEHKKFSEVAESVQRFHQAQRIQFDGKQFAKLKKQLERIKPKNVLFVIPPQILDVNLHREIFKIAPTLDNDLFADFAWGYLTARDGDAVAALWERIEGLHKNGLRNQTWLETAVVGGDMKSTVLDTPESIPAAARAGGFTGKQIYFGSTKADPEVMKFVDKNLSLMEEASVIAMTGNGDPQGIWLFDDARNADPSQHWEYDNKHVGQDMDGKLVRIKADHFRKLKLNSPVIWSGTCHSGACFRVFVESDIVSTFGTSDNTELYELPPDESMCLALIDAGAGSLLVPVASNHGMSVSMEGDFLFNHGATLGETIKSTYDDVYMQAGGVPPLSIVSVGDPLNHYAEPTMQGAGANRILIGDPALKLFPETDLPHEKTSVQLSDDKRSATVTVEWQKGFHPRGWNIFADGRSKNRRMFACMDCSEIKQLRQAALSSEDNPSSSFSVTVRIVNAENKVVESVGHAEVEIDGEKTWLHLQAAADTDDLMYEKHTATFEISW